VEQKSHKVRSKLEVYKTASVSTTRATMAPGEDAEASEPAGSETAVHDAQRTLLARALQQSEEELENVERCFRAWTARQRTVLASMAAEQKEPSALAHDVDRLRGGNLFAKVAYIVTLDSKQLGH